MALSLVTAPTAEPITIAEAKAHLRVDSDDENGLIDGLIQAAREYVETFTHRALMTQTWDLVLDDFPLNMSTSLVHRTSINDGAMWIPKPPLQSVTSITYIDTNGVTQTWGASNYDVDKPAGPMARLGRIVPGYAIVYPVTRLVPNAVTVRFVCGYASAELVPASIKSAMKLLIGLWWMNREAGALIRASADELPFGVAPLLWPYKAF